MPYQVGPQHTHTMYSSKKEHFMRRPTLGLLLFVLICAGCSYIMPPQKIPLDRRNYIDAVSTSWKEQLLTNLVKLRYGDTLTFLEMTSVNTSYALEANFSANYTTPWHFLYGTTGARNTFVGGGGLTYSDKPTISYAPIRGEALSKTLIMPIDPSKILKGLQTGWRADYVFPCCVKNINDLQNRQDADFFILVQLFRDLRQNGVIRITIDEEKKPTKYDVTVHLQDKIRQEQGRSEPGEKAGGKAGMKPQKAKQTEAEADKQKEAEDTIGLLVLDKGRAQRAKSEDKVKEFKRLLWPDASPQGKGLYSNCSECHGEKGDGKGPMASTYDPKPANFHDHQFWMSDVDQKIDQAITSGHGRMAKRNLKPEEKKAVISYLKQAFGRYEVYKIIDGNQQPRPSDPYCDKIILQTRSILQVFTMLADFIAVPQEHLSENRVQESDLPSKGKEPLNGPVDNKIMFKIESSKECPQDTFVAMQQRGYWFYINDKDFDSKEVFSGIAGILSMSEPGTKEGTPVLTLPVQ